MGIIPESEALVKPGDEFERWTVIGRPFRMRVASARWREAFVVAECRCGTVAVLWQSSLRAGTTTSCGCFNRERHTSHGWTGSRLYACWQSMRSRTEVPGDTSWHNYGGRGITVCEEWKKFEPFRDWALSNGYADHLTIDRIDNNGNYEPGNCRWATGKTQARNTRRSCLLTAFGETKTLVEWHEDSRCVVCLNTLYGRIWKGWDAEKAISQYPARDWHGRFVGQQD